MRSFIAIELPKSIVSELVKIQKEIDSLGLIKGKFVEEENFHLTLKFLGELSRSEIEAVREKLSNIKFKPFEVELSKVGVFSEDFIRIIWVSLTGEGIFQLQKTIDSELENLFPKEYNFMSHITISRPKFVEDRVTFLDELKKIKFENKKFIVSDFSLKRSQLTPHGAKYSDIEKIQSTNEIVVSA